MINILVTTGVVAAGLNSGEPDSADKETVGADEKKAGLAAKPTPQNDCRLLHL